VAKKLYRQREEHSLEKWHRNLHTSMMMCFLVRTGIIQDIDLKTRCIITIVALMS